MKKIVLTFGLIAGAIMSAMMLITVPLVDKIPFDKAEIIGYTTMVVAFLMVFFGIRSYRENIGGGTITFGRAFKVGILITVIASIMYVITWQVVFFKLAPDFVDKYAAYLIEKARASGATEEALKAQMQQMQSFMQWYRNPLINAAITFLEPLPVGLLATLISAAILRRKEPKRLHTEAAVAES